MSYLFEDLQRVRAEAVELFLEVGATEPHDYDLWRGLDQMNRQRCDEIYRRFCKIATNASDLFQSHRLLGDDAVRDLRLAARKIESALRFRELTVWDTHTEWGEEFPLAVVPPGSREVTTSARNAQSIFEEEIDRILRMLYLAEQEKGTTPSITPITGGKRGPKPIEEKVASDRMYKGLPPGDWHAKVDDNGEALDRGLRYPSEPRELRNQLTSLIRRGRTFSHAGTPLSWKDVTRLVTLGCRRLREVYGDNSPQEASYLEQTELAFEPMHTSAKERGRVYKEGMFELSSLENPVLCVNKLHIRNALQVLIEAADLCRSAALDRTVKPKEAAVDPGELPTDNCADTGPSETRVNDSAPEAAEPGMPEPRLLNRAAWLNAKLDERGWNKHDLYDKGGPEHRTTQKILDGFPVQQNVLRKVITGLQSAQKYKGHQLPPVSESDVPND